MNDLGIEFLGWHPLAAMAAAAACGWLVLRLRRDEAPAGGLRPHLGLAAVRLMALAVLAGVLAEPALAWTDTRDEAPAVALVIDRSGSMAATDPDLSPGGRLAEATALGLYDAQRRPDAAARAALLLHRISDHSDVALADEARGLARELAGQPTLAEGLSRIADALRAGTPPRADDAAALVAQADRVQAESDAALVAAAPTDGPLGTTLAQVAAMPRRERALVLAERIAAQLPQAAIDWFVLDERLVPADGSAGVRAALTGDAATDLGEGLAALARGWAGRGHPAACILLSDGRRTAGADPEPAARALAARGVRLLAVAIGDPTPPPDVVVASLDAPAEVVAGERVRLSATVRVPPGAGAWELAWLRDGAEQGRTAVTPSSGWQAVEIALPSGTARVAQWEARLTPANTDIRANGWLREVWTGLRDDNLAGLRADPRWPDQATERAVVATAMIVDPRPARGDRLRAWLLPPRDGDYRFWVSSDNDSELLIAADGNAAMARSVAGVTGWRRPDAWDQDPEQCSAPIRLAANQPAYLEAVVVNRSGSSHIAVGWTLPDGTVQRPLPLVALAPWNPAGPPSRAQSAATIANDVAERAVAVSAAPPRVLMLDGPPRWELRHAIDALEGGLLAHVDRRFRTILGPGGSLVPTQAVLDAHDMLVLGDLPPAELGADEQARIAAFVTRRGGFLVAVSGPRAMPAAYGLGPLAALLPVRSGAVDDLPEPDTAVAPGPDLARVLPDFAQPWDLLPALPWWVRGAVPRPGAAVVLDMRDRATSPLLVCAEAGAGRVAWLGSDALWRWRGQGDGTAHAALWLRLARWGLGARLSGTDRRLQVALDRAVVAPGQPTGLRVRAAMPPSLELEQIGVDGRVIPGTQRVLAPLPVADQPGTWSASVNEPAHALALGRWRLRAALAPDLSEERELLVRRDSGRERLTTSLDRAGLDRLAAAASGIVANMAEVPAAIDALAAELAPRTVIVRHRLTVWDGPWWLLLLAALLVIEWAWRRRVGLP